MLHSFSFGPAPLALGPTQMSANMLLLGLAVLGAILFGLQRLRVRHRSRLVVTTLFWREALEESRARTLFERFRHPLTYLLLALIGGLLWLSVARVEGRRVDGLSHVFLLDASATMAVGDRFEKAVDALAAALEYAPRERTEVLLCGATIRSLLGPGEDRALLAARLGDTRPAGVPESVERALVSAASVKRRAGSEHRRFVIVGHAAVDEGLRALLPEGDWVERLDVESLKVPGNLGITALGLAPAQSGAFDAVDVFIEVRGPEAEGSGVSIRLGEDSIPVKERKFDGPGVVQFICRDLRVSPAAAGKSARLLAVTLPATGGDPLAVDNYAEVLLPELRLIRTFLIPSGDAAVDAALRAACSADSAIELVDSAARADIVVGGDLPQGTLPIPALRVAPSSDQTHGIEVFDPAATSPDVLLGSALGELGLDRIDGTRLATELGQSLSLGSSLSSGPARCVSLWSELFDPARCSFTESRAFPLIVGRSARWLAAAPEIVPYSASGKPRPRRLSEAAGRGSFPWEDSSAGTQVGTSSPLDVRTTVQASRDAQELPRDRSAVSDDPGAGPWRLATWLFALLLALLLAEWFLYQRGRIA